MLIVVAWAVSSAVLKRVAVSCSAGAETGIVTFIQRFDSMLNLNIHLHMLVPDDAHTFTHDSVRFHRAPAPSVHFDSPVGTATAPSGGKSYSGTRNGRRPESY